MSLEEDSKNIEEEMPILQSTEKEREKLRLMQNESNTEMAKIAPRFDSRVQNPEEFKYAIDLVTIRGENAKVVSRVTEGNFHLGIDKNSQRAQCNLHTSTKNQPCHIGLHPTEKEEKKK